MPSYKSTVTFCVLLLITLVPHESVSAQSEEPKIEVGVQFSVMGRRTTHLGGGGRLTFNLTRNLAIEGELNYFPYAGFDNVRSLQGQFGVKSGLRFDRFGVFGKVRPGFIDSKSDIQLLCPQPCPPGVEVCTQIFPPVCPPITVAVTRFTLDVGGVVEFYPSKLVTARFDVGDTIVSRRFPTHNLQLGAGVGFRF
jgi:hypothetical protein